MIGLPDPQTSPDAATTDRATLNALAAEKLMGWPRRTDVVSPEFPFFIYSEESGTVYAVRGPRRIVTDWSPFDNAAHAWELFGHLLAEYGSAMVSGSVADFDPGDVLVFVGRHGHRGPFGEALIRAGLKAARTRK